MIMSKANIYTTADCLEARKSFDDLRGKATKLGGVVAVVLGGITYFVSKKLIFKK